MSILTGDAISRQWTDKEKLELVVILTDMIRDDIHEGRYNQIGRPNIQSVHEMIAAGPRELESYRKDFEKYVADYRAKRAKFASS